MIRKKTDANGFTSTCMVVRWWWNQTTNRWSQSCRRTHDTVTTAIQHRNYTQAWKTDTSCRHAFQEADWMQRELTEWRYGITNTVVSNAPVMAEISESLQRTGTTGTRYQRQMVSCWKEKKIIMPHSLRAEMLSCIHTGHLFLWKLKSLSSKWEMYCSGQGWVKR